MFALSLVSENITKMIVDQEQGGIFLIGKGDRESGRWRGVRLDFLTVVV